MKKGGPAFEKMRFLRRKMVQLWGEKESIKKACGQKWGDEYGEKKNGTANSEFDGGN